MIKRRPASQDAVRAQEAWRKLSPAGQLRDLLVAVRIQVKRAKSDELFSGTWVEEAFEGIGERLEEVEKRLREGK